MASLPEIVREEVIQLPIEECPLLNNGCYGIYGCPRPPDTYKDCEEYHE